MSRCPIALITDFGLRDPYVGIMKAVILGINADVQIIDLTHEVEPQAVEQGAFLLAAALPYLPNGTVCIAVVDPGVGTDRAALALQTPTGFFVGPDNGLLSAALPHQDRPADGAAGIVLDVPIPNGYRAHRLANDHYRRRPLSDTFHGRDLFAPMGAHLSRGVSISELGPPVPHMHAFPCWRAPADARGELQGRVLHADQFGNIVTDVRGSDLPTGPVGVAIAGRRLHGLQHSYQEANQFVVYIGSSGYLEIGLRNGNAAAALTVAPGDRLSVSADG